MTLTTLLLCALIFFLASFVKGTTGFGFGLLALPLLLIFLPTTFAVPLVLGLAFVDEIFLLFTIKRRVRPKRILPLLIGGIVGVPFGYLLLDRLPEQIISISVSVLIIMIGILLVSKKLKMIPNNSTARAIVGAISGIIHGVSSLAGPFLAGYLDSTGEGKEKFRTDMIIATSLMTFIAMTMLFTGGYLTVDLLISWLILLPIILFGSLMGLKAESNTNQKKFHLAVMSLVITAGIISFFSHVITFFP